MFFGIAGGRIVAFGAVSDCAGVTWVRAPVPARAATPARPVVLRKRLRFVFMGFPPCRPAGLRSGRWRTVYSMRLAGTASRQINLRQALRFPEPAEIPRAAAQ